MGKAEGKAEGTYARLRMIFGAIPINMASDIEFATVLMTSTLFRTPKKGVEPSEEADRPFPSNSCRHREQKAVQTTRTGTVLP